MVEMATYVIVLFIIQAVCILQASITGELNLLWGSLLFLLFLFRKRLVLPRNHPLFLRRKQQLMMWALGLIFLIFCNFYLSWYQASLEHSSIREMVATSTKATDLQQDALILPAAISGIVQSPVKIDGQRVSFTLCVLEVDDYKLRQPEPVVVTHYVQSLEERDRYERLKGGDHWQGQVKLSQPHPARNPGAFDYQRYLAQQGIHYVAQVEGEVRIKRVEPRFSVAHAIFDLRQRWIEQTDRLYSPSIAPLVQAMTVGEWTAIEQDLLKLYQDLGLVHLLAISGLHVTIVVGVVYAILSRLPFTRETIYLLLFLFIPVYMVFSGFNIPVIRSGLMAMAVLLFLRFRLHHHALLGLYLVLVAMILAEPNILFQMGFQLSFAITFGLITMVPKVYPFMPGKHERLKQGLAVALVAQLISLPIILYHFYAFSPLSFLLNVVVVPLYSAVYIPGAYLLTVLSFISEESISLLLWAYDHSFQFLNQCLATIYQLPYVVIHTGQPGWWWLSLVILLLINMAVWAEHGLKKRFLFSLILFPVLLLIMLILPSFDKHGYVTILDVGQGDAIVIEAPFRKEVVLIDVGGNIRYVEEEWQQQRNPFEVGRDIILPYLKYRGINRIDKIVISHGHFDHYGGLMGLLDKIPIGMVLYPPLLPQSEVELQLLLNLQAQGIPVYFLEREVGWQTDDTQFKVVHPDTGGKVQRHAHHVHQYNLVLWNKIYHTTFLWTGDVEKDGEEKIMALYPRLQAHVLKVAHHGSSTSTSQRWLEHVQPEVSVISAGLHNRYGHPHEEVLHRLHNSGTRILNTAEHGAVRFIISPSGYQVVPTLQWEGD